VSDGEIEVSLPLDDDGFMSRECPYCKMRFKINKEDFEGDTLSTEIYCPYCGQSADKDEFWTSEQIKFFEEMAIYKLVNPEIDDLFNGLKRMTKNSGPIKIEFRDKRQESRVPIAPEEIANMKFHKKNCCDITIKIDEEWNKKIYCISCGKKDE
jgi:hypothetical protein